MEQKFGPFPMWVWGVGAIAAVAMIVVVVQSSQPAQAPILTGDMGAADAPSALEQYPGQLATSPVADPNQPIAVGEPNGAMPPTVPVAEQAPTPPVPLPVYAGTTLAGKVSPLVEFNQADYEKASAENKVIVLYFYTNFDAAGKKESASALEPVFNQFRDLKVMGFRVNFKDTDTSADEQTLAKLLGVKKANTKVIVRNGQILTISTEVWDKARYEREISMATVK